MRKLIVFVFAAVFVAAPLAIGAQAAPAAAGKKATTTPTATSTAKSVKGAIARCPIVESKIQAKVAHFDNAKIKHLAVYENLKERLTKIADRLAARGADVSALRADLAALEVKIAKFNADYAVYVARLKASQEFTCGRAETQFKTQLKETKAALQQVHKDAADIRAYFVSTVRVEIMKLRDAIKPTSTSTPETVTSTQATSSAAARKVKPIVPKLPKLD